MKNKTQKTERIILMGAGAFARETLWAITEFRDGYGPYNVTGFLDDEDAKRGLPLLPDFHGEITRSLKILGSLDYMISSGFTDFDFILPAIGSTEAKKKFTERILAFNCELPGPVIHRSVEIGHDNLIGRGSIVFANSSITCNSELGLQVNVNPHCTIAHDVRIDDFCNLSPGVNITGNVHLCEGVNIGTGAVVLPGVTIGSWSIIGAGAVVKDDVPPYTIAAGIPAKVIRKRSE